MATRGIRITVDQARQMGVTLPSGAVGATLYPMVLAMSLKPLLIGEARVDGMPGPALAEGSSSARLQRFLGATTYEQMLRRVDVVNWSDDGYMWEDEEMGEECRQELERHEVIILLGRNVQRRMGRSGPYYKWTDVDGRLFAAMPHPSGRCRIWNDPAQETRAIKFLYTAVQLATGQFVIMETGEIF